ncbi:MAG: 2-oxo acid dehydrogenase subunit E2 [Bacteroidales bacterium]|nr:2-oxo acid dehydrogenase subunit E2 [Bacteroidales bacterium]
MFGYRADGKKVKNLDPIQRLMPHIMVQRADAQNSTSYDCPCEPIDAFIKKHYDEGDKYNYMHILIAAIVRATALFPRINRFICHGRIYARNCIQISFVVKKSLSSEVADTTIKLDFTGHESLPKIRDIINAAILKNQTLDTKNGTDKIARLFSLVPNFLIAFLVGTLKFLDMHGLLPKKVLDLLPFHCTAFITNLKSIKGPSIYHHIYNFGNTGMFFAMGKESLQPVVRNGEIAIGKMMPLRIVTDERFCDGFYFVNSLKKLRSLLEDPDSMMEPLAELTKDTVVQHAFNKKKIAKQNKEA